MRQLCGTLRTNPQWRCLDVDIVSRWTTLAVVGNVSSWWFVVLVLLRSDHCLPGRSKRARGKVVAPFEKILNLLPRPLRVNRLCENFMPTVRSAFCGAALNPSPLRNTALPTGSAGSVGSRRRNLLSAARVRYRSVFDFSAVRSKSAMHQAGNDRFTLIGQDVIRPLTIAGRGDEVCHLARPASPPKYQINPVQSFTTSVFGAPKVPVPTRWQEAAA